MELYLHDGMYLASKKRTWKVPIGKKLMRLDLQFGYGMMEHCRKMISSWGTGTVILSPRDLNGDQLIRLARDITAASGYVMVDPQFYLPHSDHERLNSHAYWPKNYQTSVFWQGKQLQNLVFELKKLNDQMNTSEFLVPGLLADFVDDTWLEIHRTLIDNIQAVEKNKPIAATIALNSDVVRNDTQIETLLSSISKWDVHTYYLVCEHPNGNYLVDDPSWLANILDLIAGLKLARKKVILGYCNHQMLIAACAKTDAIASGTWMNVRSFPPDKFRSAYDDEIKQRKTWYYCPQSLSEYKITYLDIAWRQGFLDLMKPDVNDSYIDILFSGSQPTSVDFKEQSAFRHYLTSLKNQVDYSTGKSFLDTVDIHRKIIDRARGLLETLAGSGIRGQNRDFSEICDANIAALEVLVSNRGVILKRKWDNL